MIGLVVIIVGIVIVMSLAACGTILATCRLSGEADRKIVDDQCQRVALVNLPGDRPVTTRVEAGLRSG